MLRPTQTLPQVLVEERCQTIGQTQGYWEHKILMQQENIHWAKRTNQLKRKTLVSWPNPSLI